MSDAFPLIIRTVITGWPWRQVLTELNIPPENIFRMHGEEIPEIAAKNYNYLLLEEVPFEAFDLMMLGWVKMGTPLPFFLKLTPCTPRANGHSQFYSPKKHMAFNAYI